MNMVNVIGINHIKALKAAKLLLFYQYIYIYLFSRYWQLNEKNNEIETTPETETESRPKNASRDFSEKCQLASQPQSSQTKHSSGINPFFDLNLRQGDYMNPVNFTDPMGTNSRKIIKIQQKYFKYLVNEGFSEETAQLKAKNQSIILLKRWQAISDMRRIMEDAFVDAMVSRLKNSYVGGPLTNTDEIEAIVNHIGNLGTSTGEAIANWQRNPDFENGLILMTTAWGEASEAFLGVLGAVKGYQTLRTKFSSIERLETRFEDWYRSNYYRLSSGHIGEGLVTRIRAKINLYPKIVDPRTGDYIKLPSNIFKRVSKSERVKWGLKERGNFIAEWYRRGYETPKGGWDKFDIHHIKPREFGGSNDFWNLVPVERTTHRELNEFWRLFIEL